MKSNGGRLQGEFNVSRKFEKTMSSCCGKYNIECIVSLICKTTPNKRYINFVPVDVSMVSFGKEFIYNMYHP